MQYLLLSWHRGLSQNEVIILPEPFEAQREMKNSGEKIFSLKDVMQRNNVTEFASINESLNQY